MLDIFIIMYCSFGLYFCCGFYLVISFYGYSLKFSYISHLINEYTMKKEHAQDRLAWHLLDSYPTRSLKEYLAYNSHQNTHQELSTSNHFHTIQIPISHQRTEPAIEIEIEIGDGKPKTIKISHNTDIEQQTKNFCRMYKLSSEIRDLLIQTIKEKYEQFQKESQMQEIMARQSLLKEVYSNVKPHEVLLNIGSPLRHGPPEEEEELLFGIIETKNSSLKNTNRKVNTNTNNKINEKSINKYSCVSSNQKSQTTSNGKSHIQALNKTKHQNKENQPQINKLSSIICNRKGKDTIISQKNRRSQQKLKALLRQKAERQEEMMKECQFKPKINAISKKVDQELEYSSVKYIREEKKLQRYEKLYENYKEIESKREQLRKNSLMEIPFKPSINLISKRIIQNKREKEDTEELTKESKSHHCSHEQILHFPKTGRKPRNRNHEGLPIGQYLYNQGMKKSKSKLKYHDQNKNRSIKASEHSDYLVNILKEKRINQLFTELTLPPHQNLDSSSVSLAHHSFKYGIFRYFLPIFNEMIELDICLSREEFMEASLRLFKTLTPEQKHEIIFKKQKQNEQSRESSMNHSKSRETLKSTSRFQNISIYNRGLEQIKMVNQRIERSREDKVREQLKKCTFRPDIQRIL